jgi:hypothetical protein
MAHPHAHDARRTGKAKMKSMGKTGNLDIPIMRAVGENQAGGVRESSSSMQMKRQAAASGMKRGGKFGHHKSKSKPDMAALMAATQQAQVPPPGPDAAMAASGAGGGAPPAPVPMQQKRGGRLPLAGHVKDAGGGSGPGRLEKVRSGHMKRGGRKH